MTFGTSANFDAMASLRNDGQGDGTGRPGRRDSALQAAFETQMRMTQSLFGERGHGV